MCWTLSTRMRGLRSATIGNSYEAQASAIVFSEDRCSQEPIKADLGHTLSFRTVACASKRVAVIFAILRIQYPKNRTLMYSRVLQRQTISRLSHNRALPLLQEQQMQIHPPPAPAATLTELVPLKISPKNHHHSLQPLECNGKGRGVHSVLRGGVEQRSFATHRHASRSASLAAQWRRAKNEEHANDAYNTSAVTQARIMSYTQTAVA